MIKKKKDTLFSKKITDFWGLVTLVLALAAFFTGKTDIKSFFHDVTLLNFITTFGKTILIYALCITLIVSSLFIIFDFILLIFGLKFPIAKFLWSSTFISIVINWWWNESLSENIFLSVLLMYVLSSYDIETKTRIYSLFYKKIGKKLDGFSMGIGFSPIRHKGEGIHIGLIVIQNKASSIDEPTEAVEAN